MRDRLYIPLRWWQHVAVEMTVIAMVVVVARRDGDRAGMVAMFSINDNSKNDQVGLSF